MPQTTVAAKTRPIIQCVVALTLFLPSVAVHLAMAQTPEALPSLATPIAASSATVVPMLVRYDGAAIQIDGKPKTGAGPVTFLIFKNEKGGEPVWTETQTVAFDQVGKYEVYLGSTYSSGLPSDLFGAGEARWLEVQIAGEAPGARTLLTSVPYALKAADAATLGGLPASAFALAGTTGIAAIQANGIAPDAASNVTTTGGTNFYLPRFTGSSTVVSSEIYDSGTSVGIGVVPNAGVKLDVGGAMIMRGNMTVSRTGNATSSKAYPSYGFDFFSNVYNSSTKVVDNPYFQLQSEPTGNNTASPSATFNLLFANNGNAVGETGFYFNPDGTIHFASGQTFAQTSSSGVPVDGTSSSGTGVEGTSTSNSGVQGNSTSSYGVLGVTGAGSGAAAGVYGYSASAVPGVKGASASGNGGEFYGGGNGNGLIAVGAGTGYGIEAITTASYGQAIYANAQGPNSTAIYGNSNGGSDAINNPSIGVQGNGDDYGVSGFTYGGTGVYGTYGGAGVYGTYQAQSKTGNAHIADLDLTAGVWGDSGADNDYSNGYLLGSVLGTADNNHAGWFENNSSVDATMIVRNDGAGDTINIADVLQAYGANGMCGIGTHGDISCTGQVKTLSTTRGARTVETYAMQSPENWMEDFGSASLSSGTATVSIEPAFAETANTVNDYHVFLTARGDSDGLYVTNLTATSFEVHESKHGTSSMAFDYRIVARRRGYEAQRMVDVTDAMKAMKARDDLRTEPHKKAVKR